MKIMDKDHEKMMANLQRLIAGKKFKSKKALNDFLASLADTDLRSLPSENLSRIEEAQDLVFEAYELPIAKAKRNIAKALALNPDCIEAYEFLGSISKDLEASLDSFLQGVEIGKRIFGGKYLKENRGYFWGLHETRPYMRCLTNVADCFRVMGNVVVPISIYEEMILLNPSDNQGVRDLLMPLLIEANEKEKFKKYEKLYQDAASAFYLFNVALMEFKIKGVSSAATKKLKMAITKNEFIVPTLLTNKKLPPMPNSYSWESKEEAIVYVYNSRMAWLNTENALGWLKLHV